MTETGNNTLIQTLSDIVNLVVKQKGGKRGTVKSVDEEKLLCNVDPDDGSAPIEGASLTSQGGGVYLVPEIGSKVTLVPLHLDDESENDFGVVQVSEVSKSVSRIGDTKKGFYTDLVQSPAGFTFKVYSMNKLKSKFFMDSIDACIEIMRFKVKSSSAYIIGSKSLRLGCPQGHTCVMGGGISHVTIDPGFEKYTGSIKE